MKLSISGLIMKNVTGSRKVIEILNKHGYCISYNSVEEIETELTYSLTESSASKHLPADIVLSPDFPIGVAFDNQDRFVETANGKNTLHDTVGIAYQTKHNFNNEISSSGLIENQNHEHNKRRRRCYNIGSHEVEPYFKKPKPSISMNTDYATTNYNTIDYNNIDTIHMLSHACNIPDTPMWVGWNSKFLKDSSQTQKIWYLPQINESPTSNSVVLQTMKTSLEIAEEADQNFICVTYDLAIAKIAIKIQEEEAPTYDKIFIQLGSFHIELALFRVLGKYVEGSGAEYLLQESGVLAPGSTNTFIAGTHYNRYV
jgi:hypothetical protein